MQFVASVRRKMHLSLIFLEFLSEMDLEVLGLPSKISAERAVLRVLSEESSRECPMRIAFDPQRRFDCPPVLEVRLNTSCRDEIIPILKGLQHIYSQPELRDELLDAVAQDVNGTSSADLGRPGMTYWSILVLGAVRLGCNFDYDRLQNLAEEHRSLRQVMGIGGWCDDQTFDWRCLRDNICLLSPDTIERVNHLIVAEGHRLVPEAAETVRGDSFVPATNIHYPTDSSLIGDGLRTIVPLAVRLARLLGLGGWRQRKHLLRTVKKQLRAINKIAKGKGRDFPKRLQDGYRTLLDLADRILARALELLDPALISIAPSAAASRINMLKEKLTDYLNMTIHVCDLARRRVLEGERIDNSEKLFSLFEPHTELIIRGKVPQPLEFGHRVLVIEDGAGFVCHYAILPRGAEDSEVLVEEMKQAQQRLNGRIRRASFDRGFHSPENQRELVKLVEQPCLPKPGHVQAQRQEQEATVEFRQARRRHPGIESAIGALQSGNGLDRCRDKNFGGYCRYVGLGILGRNLQVLGKLLIAREEPKCEAGQSRRGRTAA
jgi:transposase, IS5 family